MLTTDLHAHFLFATDDGPRTLEESLRMTRLAAADGVRDVYCTSHLDTEDKVAAVLADRKMKREALQQAAAAEELPVTFHRGAEWMLTPEMVEVLPETPEGWLGSSRAFLFEISAYHPFSVVPMAVKATAARGLKPLFAHPERYRQLATTDAAASLEPVVAAGAALQLTAASFTGLFGARAEKLAWTILDAFPEDVVLASDAHESEVRVPGLARAAALIEKKRPGAVARMEKRMAALLTTA